MELGLRRHVPMLANASRACDTCLFAQILLGKCVPSFSNPPAKAATLHAYSESLARISPEYEREFRRRIEDDAEIGRQQRHLEFVARILNIDEEWDPDQHPRGGYPENRGWFSPAWGSAAGALAAGLGMLLADQRDPNEILDRAKTALDALLANHAITQKERDLRVNILDATVHHKMGFNAKAPPSPKYYETNAKGNWVLKPGQVANGLDDRVYNRSGYNRTGCRKASQSLMLQGMAVQAKALGKAGEFDKAVAGKEFDKLLPVEGSSDFHAYSMNPKLGDLIPGDRVRMRNHKFDPNIDASGFEGSNVIYLGKSQAGDQLFLHMDGGSIGTFPQLQKTVQGYSPLSRRDPNINNYKLTERYRPLVPPSSQ